MIRPAVATDRDALVNLETQCFGAEAWSVSALEDELSVDRLLLVATEPEGTGSASAGSEVAGYVDVSVVAEVADLLRIAVLPTARRQGVARALLDAVTDRAARSGAERMMLEVGEQNAPAIAFYAAMGFVEISRRPRYYRDGSAALVLQRPTTGAG